MKIRNRTDLAEHFNELGFKVGAEIGVLAGEYAAVLCEKIPGLKYYGVDSWDESFDNDFFVQAFRKVASHDSVLIKKTSMDALDDFEDGSLDFVYIDADHAFDSVVRDIIGWTKKVKKKGIVSGDDYHKKLTDENQNLRGVKYAVEAYTRSHGFKFNFLEDSSWWFTK